MNSVCRVLVTHRFRIRKVGVPIKESKSEKLQEEKTL